MLQYRMENNVFYVFYLFIYFLSANCKVLRLPGRIGLQHHVDEGGQEVVRRGGAVPSHLQNL